MKYETNTNRLKLCALCNNRIVHTDIVCQDHKKEYELYQSATWFVEMVAAQQRQYEIDVEEYRAINNRTVTSLQKQSNTRGKQLSNSVKTEILRLYASGIGDRKISKKLNLSYKTVNTFLWRHRRKNKKCSAIVKM